MFEDRPSYGTELTLIGRSNVGKSTLMRQLTGRAVDTGRRPGVTTTPMYHGYHEGDFLVTDLPGFGFMAGVDADQRDRIKTGIVRYLEEHASAIVAGVLVLDGSAAVEIIDRHLDRGEAPYDLEFHDLLTEVGIEPIIAVNKLDNVDRRDETLDAIADRFGYPPPWQQWSDRIAPIVAKRGSIGSLLDVLYDRLAAAGHGALRGYLPDRHQ